MKKILSAAIATLFIAGCQQPQTATAQASTPAVAATTGAASPAMFEIRDFTLDENKGEYTTTVKGRGTLVTKDSRLASGNYMVWISAKQEHENDDPWRTQILLEDGIGTFTTFDMPDKGEKLKYYDWEVLGYLPLEKGQMKPGNAAPKGS